MLPKLGWIRNGWSYTADGSTNYLTTVTSLTSADVALDTQIKTNTDAIATNATSNTNIQSELDATQTGLD
ncbi:hypothetical protein BST83_01610 [Polaribacter filamentus]|uniref:Uncharacterized protein n=1 Tax=Polaribacter filamentus TaxID=53483 RepID=A0A2S7L2C8_9FLAO|nr:hypothetical protein [Polaribacter filamentus]PQB09065.1 hypothetical protein BST83_01610 [Polaribacter filamentus]